MEIRVKMAGFPYRKEQYISKFKARQAKNKKPHRMSEGFTLDQNVRTWHRFHPPF